MSDFSHLDADGKAKMVDVGSKPVTSRRATATADVRMLASTAEGIQAHEIKKGDVLNTARLAAIMAAKRTSELIPLCHQIPLDDVRVDFEFPAPDLLRITATASCHARTGVEMEALVAATHAALTVYDMCKAVDRAMCVEHVRLEAKQGGKSGDYKRA